MINPSEISLSTKRNVPKYKQLALFFIKKIKSKQILAGSKLPSINEISFEKDLSRDTVERAYNELKEIGFVETSKGLGHFVSSNIDEFKIKKSKILKDLFNSFCKKDTGLMKSFYHKDYTLIDPKNNKYKKKDVLKNLKIIYDLFDNINFQKLDLSSLNSSIITKRYSSDFSTSIVLNTFSADGNFSKKKISIPMHLYYEWSGNKIIREIQFFDLTLFDQELDYRDNTLFKIYNKNNKPCVFKNADFKTLINEINKNHLGAVVVINKKYNPIGIITDGDIRRKLISGSSFNRVKAIDIMTEKPILVNKNMSKKDALELMKQKSINHLIIVNNRNEYIGVVNFLNLIKRNDLKINL